MLEESIKGSVLEELLLRGLLDIQVNRWCMELDIGERISEERFRREVYRWH